MGDIKVTFFGLCYFRVLADESEREVYLVSHQHHPHIATLAVRSGDLDIDGTSREPTAIVHEGSTQIACFDIPRSQARITTLTLSGDGIKSKNWGKADRDETMNFHRHHGTFESKLPGELTKFLTARLVLKGGKIDTKDFSPKLKALDKKNPPNLKQDGIARSISWIPDGDGLTIAFNDDTGNVGNTIVVQKTGLVGDRTLTVTNVPQKIASTVEEANMHFALYYEIAKTQILENDRLQLEGVIHARGEEVYDCVPPGTGS